MYLPLQTCHAQDVWLQILDNAVKQSCENAQLVSRRSTPNGEYLEYEVPGLFGKDYVE